MCCKRWDVKSKFSNETLESVICPEGEIWRRHGGAKFEHEERIAADKERSSWKSSTKRFPGGQFRSWRRRKGYWAVGGRRDVAGSRDLIIRARRNPLLLARASRVNDKSSRHEHCAFSRFAASLSAVVPLPLFQTFLSRGGGSVPLVNMPIWDFLENYVESRVSNGETSIMYKLIVSCAFLCLFYSCLWPCEGGATANR